VSFVEADAASSSSLRSTSAVAIAERHIKMNDLYVSGAEEK
jgi:hypothetical protein